MAKRNTSRRGSNGHPFRTVLVVLFLMVTVWFVSLYMRIDRVAQEDQAASADAIAVFGAAQYVGRPSPVYHARLDHVVSLYERGMAPVIVTMGGSSDPKSGQSEGAVGRDYLLSRGIPFDRIIAETQSLDTSQQVDELSQIARTNGWQRVIVVSDGTHLFRIRALCDRVGLHVLTSPRAPYGNLSRWGYFRRVTHEMLSYTLMRLHVEAGWTRRWMEGREES